MNDAEYRTRVGHGFILGVSLPLILGAAGLAVAGATAGGMGWDQLASASPISASAPGRSSS